MHEPLFSFSRSENRAFGPLAGSISCRTGQSSIPEDRPSNCKRRRKKKPLPNMAELKWFDRTELDALFQKKLAMPVKLELEHHYFSPPVSGRRQAQFLERCRLASPLLSYSHLREEVLSAQGFSTLSKEIMVLGCSKPMAYKLYPCYAVLALLNAVSWTGVLHVEPKGSAGSTKKVATRKQGENW
ncbi:hypothetical protein [Uliginosibacterium gangwonense]|uniref:hypothetical protein n=1 Tax=Uliginosibacterium gangwonense TaxID=392736 RepID=UPI0012F9E7DF|nr:hypothetical protein [Uliginosibacterium gangwonense]